MLRKLLDADSLALFRSDGAATRLRGSGGSGSLKDGEGGAKWAVVELQMTLLFTTLVFGQKRKTINSTRRTRKRRALGGSTKDRTRWHANTCSAATVRKFSLTRAILTPATT